MLLLGHYFQISPPERVHKCFKELSIECAESVDYGVKYLFIFVDGLMVRWSRIDRDYVRASILDNWLLEMLASILGMSLTVEGGESQFREYHNRLVSNLPSSDNRQDVAVGSHPHPFREYSCFPISLAQTIDMSQ